MLRSLLIGLTAGATVADAAGPGELAPASRGRSAGRSRRVPPGSARGGIATARRHPTTLARTGGETR